MLMLEDQIDQIAKSMRRANEEREQNRQRLERMYLYFQEMDAKIEDFFKEYWSRHEKG